MGRKKAQVSVKTEPGFFLFFFFFSLLKARTMNQHDQHRRGVGKKTSDGTREEERGVLREERIRWEEKEDILSLWDREPQGPT